MQKEKQNNEDDNNYIEEEEDDNEKIDYPKPEKYEKIDIIFCDDLNGWSKPKKVDLIK